MSNQILSQPSRVASDRWLKYYYFTRAAVSVLWVVAAFTIGESLPPVGAILFVLYPAWDAAANLADARRNGGLRRNPTQALNAGVSILTAVAVGIAVLTSMNAALGVIGVWAALAGLLQLATGVRRWKTSGAQWVMILSGAQSTIAGVFFLQRASTLTNPSATSIVPYVLFGAFYFLVSAIWLTVTDIQRRKAIAV